MEILENNSRRYKVFSDTVLVAYITAVSYLSAYLYQYSFLHYYGIPADFVQVGLPQVLSTALLVISYGGFFLLAIFSASRDLKNGKVTLVKEVLVFVKLFLVMFSVSVFTIYPLIHSGKKSIIIASIVSTILAVVFRIGWGLGKKGNITHQSEKNIIDIILNKIGIYKGTLIIIGLLSLCIASVAGDGFAGTKVEYLTINTEPKTILIKPYSTGFLAIEFGENQNGFNQKIHYIDTKEFDNQKLLLIREHIGPLRNQGIYVESDFLKTYLIRNFGDRKIINLFFR